MKNKRLMINASLAGLLIGTALAAAWARKPYTSTALLRVVPPSIPEGFVAANNSSNMEADRIRVLIAQPVLSRGNLSILIDAHNLYAAERARLPTFDVIEQMRAAVRIEPAQANSFTVSFTYPDARLAQMIAAELVTRLRIEHTRFRTNQAAMTLQFMQESAETAGVDFEQSMAKLRAAQSAGRAPDRLKLDADIARQRYERLSARRADAEMLYKLERRQQGPTLDVLDPASLPNEWRPSLFLSGSAGLIAGALLGLLISVLRGSGRREPAVQVS
jgi:uncharacterized protein involved in exopolysaccharide biosynthesis